MQKILRTIGIFLFVLALLAPVAAFALTIDTNYVPLTDIPGIKGASAQNPGGILQGLFNLAIGIGGILAIIMIIFAGFKYMYQESIFEKSDAKAKITNAFFGLLLILGSYIILKTINGDLLRINLFLPQGDGKLANLVTSKEAQDEVMIAMNQAAQTMSIGLQKADELQREADSLKKVNSAISDRIDKLLAEGKKNDDPVIADLISTVYDNQQKIKALETDATKVRTDAQQQAREDFIRNQQKLTAVDLVSYNVDSATERKQKITTVLQKSVDTINNDPSLTPAQKTKKISDINALAGAEKYMIDRQLEASSILKSDSGSLVTGNLKPATVTKLDTLKNDLTQTLSKVDQNYQDPVLREKVRSSISDTITGIDNIKKASEETSAESRSKAVKVAVAFIFNPVSGLVCLFSCGN